ncbi:MAG: polysaccharide biosynthesis protein [candidate division WOR-3 bacterium]
MSLVRNSKTIFAAPVKFRNGQFSRCRYAKACLVPCGLGLEAAYLGRGGELFVLDMGEPVCIWNLAHRKVELASLTSNRDIPILTGKPTGKPRPGEKLFEELLTAEEVTIATQNDCIYQAHIARQHCYLDLLSAIQELERQMEISENLQGLKQSCRYSSDISSLLLVRSPVLQTVIPLYRHP